MPGFVQTLDLRHRPFIPHAVFHKAIKRAAHDIGLTVIWRKPAFCETHHEMRQAYLSLIPHDALLSSTMFFPEFVQEHINCMVEGFLETLVIQRDGVVVQPLIRETEFVYYLW